MLIGKTGLKFLLKLIGHSDKKRYKKFVKANRCSMKKNISYVNDDNIYHMFDIYYPEHSNGITLIDIHGGGYLYGVKENNFDYCYNFVKRGFTVVNINYRLLEKDLTVIDQVYDIINCIDYLYEEKEPLSLSFENLSLAGDSAGGHLALLSSLIYRSEELQNRIGMVPKHNVDIKKLCLSSPVFSINSLLNLAKSSLKTKALPLLFSNQHNNQEYLDLIDCSKLIVDIIPPLTYVSTSKHDLLVSEGLALASMFKKYHYPVYLDYVDSDDRRIGHVYNIVNQSSNEAINTNRLQCDFLEGKLVINEDYSSVEE